MLWNWKKYHEENQSFGKVFTLRWSDKNVFKYCRNMYMHTFENVFKFYKIFNYLDFSVSLLFYNLIKLILKIDRLNSRWTFIKNSTQFVLQVKIS